MRPWWWRKDCQRGDALVIWCLGLAVLLLPLGGISVDLWHGISDERALQAAASAAAIAGSSGIDQTAYRANGSVVLDPRQATQLAAQTLADQSGTPTLSQAPVIWVAPDRRAVTVQLQEHLALTLLRVLLGNRTINLEATATAAPEPSGAPK
jgi:Flp pilus assembly protein TadG